ncbi:MAG TPA: hypothetical protein VHD91_12595 [Gaiellaceae bacterium]|nr:hypothetical protein [Gaiellaceae bacterium]
MELVETREMIRRLLDAESVGPDAHERALDRLRRLRRSEAGLVERIAELEVQAAA